MKKKIVMLLFVVVVGILCSKNILQSHSLTPPVGNTGAPGETTCAQAGCHGGSGTGGVACTHTLKIVSSYLGLQYNGSGIPTNLYYKYDTVFKHPQIIADTLTFTLSLPSAPIAGFQMTATSGSFKILDTNTTQIIVSSGKQYISHKSSTNGSNSWKFQWYPTSSLLPTFYFSTVCDTASVSGGNGGGGSCVPSCTGSSSSGAFAASSSVGCFTGSVGSLIQSPPYSFCLGDSLYTSGIDNSGIFAPNVRLLGQSISVLNGNSVLNNTSSFYPITQSYVKLKPATETIYNVLINWAESCNSPFDFGPMNSLCKFYSSRYDFAFFSKIQTPKLLDINGCNPFTDTIGLLNYTGKLSDMYYWLQPNNLNNSLVQNPVASVNTTTTFHLSVYPSYNSGLGYYNNGVYSSFGILLRAPVGCITYDSQTVYIHQPSSASTSTTICKNESYLFNGNSYSSAGIFKDTLVNYVGCDSITTLNLNVRTDEPISIGGTICKSGRFIFNGKMYNTSGIFTDTIFSNTSCDTVYTLTLSTAVIPVDTSVTISNGMLIAHATNSTFQWYDCAVNNLIQGAVDDTLLPLESGYYSVIVTTQPEHCIDTSACKFIFVSGINTIDELKQTQLYPNPINNELHIQFSKNIKSGTIKILDLNGAEILNQSFNNKQFVQLSTKNLATGIYVVEVQSGNSVWHQKMMKR